LREVITACHASEKLDDILVPAIVNVARKMPRTPIIIAYNGE